MLRFDHMKPFGLEREALQMFTQVHRRRTSTVDWTYRAAWFTYIRLCWKYSRCFRPHIIKLKDINTGQIIPPPPTPSNSLRDKAATFVVIFKQVSYTSAGRSKRRVASLTQIIASVSSWIYPSHVLHIYRYSFTFDWQLASCSCLTSCREKSQTSFNKSWVLL